MFQTFSGNSRRPRQVNLSGQNTNPFAPSSFSPAASGTQKTVAAAQQERQLRQQERERLNASKRIQRTWRGHKVRRDLADSRRKVWDNTEIGREGSSEYITKLAEQLQLLLAFFSSKSQDDIERLVRLSERIYAVDFESFLARDGVRSQVSRLAKVILSALETSLPKCPITLLQLLVAIVMVYPSAFPRISRSYYHYLSMLVTRNIPENLDRSLIMTALRAPLIEHIDLERSNEMVLNAYSAFALQFLTTHNIAAFIGPIEGLASFVSVEVLSAALVHEFSVGLASQIPPDNRLWLLAQFVAINRLQKNNSQEHGFLRALSLQLSSSSAEIVERIDATDSEVMQGSNDVDEEDLNHQPIPLPPFIKDELSSLVNQASITGLLAKFNIDYAKASNAGEEDASLLASYALTLLRIFPRQGDEIRMWLYLGSMTTSPGSQLPALKFFWQTMSSTSIFAAIRGDSKEALTILRPQIQSTTESSSDLTRDREWRNILLFLELYTFVLRFTDDEEFLSGGAPNLGQIEEPVSRIRESALPLEDVKQLTIFLKNLAFTTYYNAGELSDDEQNNYTGLGTYFGVSNPSRFQSPGNDTSAKRAPRRPFAGIAGMTFDYVRTIVTGVMRMLYERDSRRRFLPRDHWLMTSRFEMEGFIPAVVMEEERQNQVREAGEDDEVEDDQDFESRSNELALVGMARPRRAQQIESMRRQQQKAARKKVLAQVGPRLEVLQNMPFSIPFETRVQIFRQFVYLDQNRRRNGHVDPDRWRMSMVQNALATRGGLRGSGREVLGRHHAKIRRGDIFQDAFEQFYELGEGLKEPIQITFVDKFDTVEAGIDGGGVTKEFLTSVTSEAFRDDLNLFVTNDQNLLYPNPSSVDQRQSFLKQSGLSKSDVEWKEAVQDLLRQYEFLGRIIGKCLYEGILVDVNFAGFFLLKWAASGASGSGSGYRANINDLRDLDESLYEGLLKLKNYPGNVEDFSLDFTITDNVSQASGSHETITRDLTPNGSNIAVTNENRPLYVSYVARHRLQVQPYQQTQAFLRGLGQIIKPSWLSMFNQSELQTLIGGDSSEIDVEDLRNNTAYGGVYQIGDDGLEHPTIQLFWKVLKDLDDTDRRKVLKYVTSTPRAPLLGFSQLNPRFSIRDAGGDEERLPSTSTCVNLLKLPRYSNAETLRHKLVYAVNSGAGFDLS